MKNPLISCNHIGFSIGEQEILRDVSFTLFPGETIALVGPNGVGKSTLMKIIAGLQDPDKGNIERLKNIRVAYMPQEMPWDRGVADLSGGEKSRISLSKAMNDRADVYLLDEPTNNLDLPALKLLDSFIGSKKGRSSFIIVSHDRQLLENTADKILEIDPYTRSGSIYPEKFSEYISMRKQRIENEWRKYNDYLSEKRSLERSLQEKKQWSSKGEDGPKKTDNERMARGNAKDWSGKILGSSVKVAANKLYELEEVKKPREIPIITYNIPMRERSGDAVFRADGVVKMFGDRKIGPIDFDVRFGDRVVITGDNGAGKTTLLKMLMGRVAPDAGAVSLGSSVDIGYLPQESELGDEAILENIKKLDHDSETEFRKILNNLGITKDEVKKGKNELSPGERSRFILALLISKKPNCLILDEPTNHLDIYALDFLEEAIRAYKGTLIIITHDRYFMSRIGNHKIFNLQ